MKKLLGVLVLASLNVTAAFAAEGRAQVDVGSRPSFRSGMMRPVARILIQGDAAGALYQMIRAPEQIAPRGPYVGDMSQVYMKSGDDLICYRREDRRWGGGPGDRFNNDFNRGFSRSSYNCETRMNDDGEIEKRSGWRD
jgi:hypothetical protein